MNASKHVYAVLALGFATLMNAASAADLPSFLGYISLSDEKLFSLEWHSDSGKRYHSWLKVGESAGPFKLLDFDRKRNVLTVEGTDARVYPLSLPAAQFTDEALSEGEYKELYAFYSKYEKRHSAPILSREKARAFLIRLVTEQALKQPARTDGRNVTFDLEGLTLPPERRAKWEFDTRRALKENRVLLVVVVDDKPVVTYFPLRIDDVPERMVRSLDESDWEEIALLNATFTLKNIVGAPRK